MVMVDENEIAMRMMADLITAGIPDPNSYIEASMISYYSGEGGLIGEAYKCKICGQGYFSAISLLDHLCRKHGFERPYSDGR